MSNETELNCVTDDLKLTKEAYKSLVNVVYRAALAKNQHETLPVDAVEAAKWLLERVTSDNVES